MKHYFKNAQLLHRQNPNTFFVPTYQELSKLKANDSVKVCLNNERFWVLITSVKGNTIVGKVDNHLFFNDLSAGESITVRFSNVFDYQYNH